MNTMPLSDKTMTERAVSTTINEMVPGTAIGPVSSFNEWDPLEEVIVGRLEGATIPSNHITVTFNIPRAAQPFFRFAAGWRFPGFMKKSRRRSLMASFVCLRWRVSRSGAPISSTGDQVQIAVVVLARLLHRLSARWFSGDRR